MSEKSKLPIVEIFSSLEGEGLYIGTPTIFVRVAGCNVGCKHCDSKKTWSTKNFKYLDLDVIITTVKELIEKSGTRRVSITGGEPLLYKDEIVELAKGLGPKVMTNLETSGTIIFPYNYFYNFTMTSIDIKTPSSGVILSEENLELLKKAVQHSGIYVKAIIMDDSDLDFVIKHFNTTNFSNTVSFTPCEVNGEITMPAQRILERAKEIKFKWRYLAQQHKLVHYE